MIPSLPPSLHTCYADTLWQPCPSNNPLWIPAGTPSDLAGVVWDCALWCLLHPFCNKTQLLFDHGAQTCRNCISQGWALLVSVIPSQCTGGALLWRRRYVKGAFSLWGCFPMWLGQMTVPVTPAGTLLRLSLHKHCIFASGTSIPLSPYWQGSFKQWTLYLTLYVW